MGKMVKNFQKLSVGGEIVEQSALLKILWNQYEIAWTCFSKIR